MRIAVLTLFVLALCFPLESRADHFRRPSVRSLTLPPLDTTPKESKREYKNPKATDKTIGRIKVRRYEAQSFRSTTKIVTGRTEKQIFKSKITTRTYAISPSPVFGSKPIDPLHPLKGYVPEVRIVDLEKHARKAGRAVSLEASKHRALGSKATTALKASEADIRKLIQKELRKHPPRTITKIVQQQTRTSQIQAPRIDEDALARRVAKALANDEETLRSLTSAIAAKMGRKPLDPEMKAIGQTIMQAGGSEPFWEKVNQAANEVQQLKLALYVMCAAFVFLAVVTYVKLLRRRS